MTEHTKGPWQAFPMERGGLKGFVIDTALGNDADNAYVIADHIFGEQAEANARLIAAAPDLLSALEAAAETLEAISAQWVLGEPLDEMLHAAHDDAVVALAKARGEQSA